MNKSEFVNNNRGVTLIEFIIVIGLFAVILTIAGSGFVLGLNAFNFVENEVYDHQNLNFAATSLIMEARVATSIDVNITNPNIVLITILRSNDTQVLYRYVISEEILYKDDYPLVTGLTAFEAYLTDLDNDGSDDLLVLNMMALDESNVIRTNVRLR